MYATDDVEEFKASPVGRCFVGPSFVTWCGAPDLVGVTVWGPLNERGIREMMALSAFVKHPDISPRRRSLVDCRDVERVDSEILLGFTAMMRDRVQAWTAAMERQALIVPAGLEGVLIAGTLPSLGPSHPLRILQDLDSAIAYIDHPAARTAHTRVTEIATASNACSAFVVRLRAQLRRDLAAASIGSIATSLGMSTRSLQRELRRLDTSFSEELRRVRVATENAPTHVR